LRGRFRHQTVAPLAGSQAKAFYGRFGKLHLDGADRLDSRGSILFLWLPDTLARGLASQFYSALSHSGARKRRHSDCVCADLQPLFLNIEHCFVFLWFVMRTGPVSTGLGAIRDDGDFSLLLRVGSILVSRLFAGSITRPLRIMVVLTPKFLRTGTGPPFAPRDRW